MTNFDLAVSADNGWLLPLFQAADRQDWTLEEVEQKMKSDRGVMRIERPRLFCSVEFYKLDWPIVTKDDAVVIPAGMATQVKDLLPQHNSQEWVDRTLAPLLTETLIEVGKRWPEALSKPIFAFMDTRTAEYWGRLFGTELTPNGSRTIIWVPTLQQTIDKALAL